MQHTIRMSAQSSLTDGQHGLICSVSSLACDGCLGSGFSLRHNIGQTNRLRWNQPWRRNVYNRAGTDEVVRHTRTHTHTCMASLHLSCQGERRSLWVSDSTRLWSHHQPVSCNQDLPLLTWSRWKTSTAAWIPIWLWQLIVELLWLL